MKRWSACLIVGLMMAFAYPVDCPAPLIYRPGEGWIYEPVGGDDWTRDRAKAQLTVARDAFEQEDYGLTIKAARRTVKTWPFSDYAPEAQFLLGKAYVARGQDERAFEAFQTLLEKYPKIDNYEEVLQAQYDIAYRFLQGQWFKLWGYIPLYPSMEKTVELYQKLIKNGPYSQVAPQAQLDIGKAWEKKEKFGDAVKAYETAADRYHDREEVAADALFKAGMAYHNQTTAAEYDQHATKQAINRFTDFMALYPEDPRVPEAKEIIQELKTEQARGSLEIARFYEDKERWKAALIYYNEVLVKDPDSEYARIAKERIDAIQEQTTQQTAQR